MAPPISYTFMNSSMMAAVDGPLDSSVPVVILLHGLGGTAQDMTDPATARPGLAYDRTAVYPLYSDAGFHPTPPLVPVAGFYADAPDTALTSWRQSLNAAGFTTITYTMVGATTTVGSTIAADAAQLAALAAAAAQALPGMRFAIVAHSRGGLVARAFLTSAATSAELSGFLARMTSVITLHSPHGGSSMANLAASVDPLLASIQTALSSVGIAPPGVLSMLRTSTTANRTVAELMVGSPVLAAIAAAEPVPGITYHTFGGTSTAVLRLWARLYTPDSTLPIPVPFPFFHWGITPVPVCTLLDSLSLVPSAVLAPTPLVTELTAVMVALAAAHPEFRSGAGDLLVTDALARLPFAADHGTNPINHAEALWDPGLQAQVVAILARLRDPTVSGKATTRLVPYPATVVPRTYTVTAADALTGAALTSGWVTVDDTFGGTALRVPLGTPFSHAFKGRKEVTIDPQGRRSVESVFPSVSVTLPAPYGTVPVDTGE